jgi:hypothetical protein
MEKKKVGRKKRTTFEEKKDELQRQAWVYNTVLDAISLGEGTFIRVKLYDAEALNRLRVRLCRLKPHLNCMVGIESNEVTLHKLK